MKVLEIDENTRLPLRVVYGAVVLVAAATVWLTTLHYQVAHASTSIIQVQAQVEGIDTDRIMRREALQQSINALRTDQARMEAKLDLLLEKL